MKWYSYLDDSTDTGAEVLASAVQNNVGISTNLNATLNGVQITVVGTGSTTLTLS